MIIQIGTEADESRILWKHSESDEWQRADIDDLIDAYESRPTGEWVIHDEVKNIYGGIYIECSECGTKFVTQTLEDERFCRNCGAEMRGE